MLGVLLEAVEPEGVVVQRLTRSAAAKERGIRTGDVLLTIDGKPVDSAAAAIQALRDHPEHEPLNVRLKRRGVELELEIQL